MRADVTERAEIRDAFAQADTWLVGSPLYRTLARVVRENPALLELAAQTRPGPLPLNMLMSATHMIVLRNPELPFARFFPSVSGDEAQDPAGTTAEYPAFCAAHRDALVAILHERLVQTNVAARSIALRLALHEVRRRVSDPVALIEIGASAGAVLCFDRWGIDIGGRSFGPADAAVRLSAAWLSPSTPVPDLDDLPEVVERIGIDLHPLSAADPEDRLWLRALVWPEHRDRLAQLDAILDAVAQDPPVILAGDAIELLPRVAAELPAIVPIVAFHAMVRCHVPSSSVDAFDTAIARLGVDRRLLHVTFESRPTQRLGESDSPVVRITDTHGPSQDLAVGDGHAQTFQPLRPKSSGWLGRQPSSGQ